MLAKRRDVERMLSEVFSAFGFRVGFAPKKVGIETMAVTSSFILLEAGTRGEKS